VCPFEKLQLGTGHLGMLAWNGVEKDGGRSQWRRSFMGAKVGRGPPAHEENTHFLYVLGRIVP
jgi:hypothetical protein